MCHWYFSSYSSALSFLVLWASLRIRLIFNFLWIFLPISKVVGILIFLHWQRIIWSNSSRCVALRLHISLLTKTGSEAAAIRFNNSKLSRRVFLVASRRLMEPDSSGRIWWDYRRGAFEIAFSLSSLWLRRKWTYFAGLCHISQNCRHVRGTWAAFRLQRATSSSATWPWHFQTYQNIAVCTEAVE